MSNLIRVSTVTLHEKCFKHFSGPSKPFNQYNILFGLNGHGKSTLAKSIQEKALEEGVTKDQLRIYNAQYIKDTLTIKEDAGKIASVKANFGKNNTGIEEKVAVLEGEVGKFEETLNGIDGAKGLVDQGKDCIADIETEIKTIHTANKGRTTIKLKFSTTNPFEMKVLKAYEDDYEVGLKKFKKEVVAKSSGDDNYEEELERINSTNIHVVLESDILPFDSMADATNIMTKAYGSSTPNTNELEWLIEGLHVHGKSKTCKFCLNEADLAEIKKRVEGYQKDTKVSDMMKLKGIVATIDAYIICSNKLILSRAEYRELYKDENSYKEDFDMMQACNLLLNELKSSLEAKITDNELTDKLNSDYYYTSARLIEEQCEKLELFKQRASAEKIELINLQNTLVRARIGHDIIESELIKKKSDEHAGLVSGIAEIRKQIETKNNEIKVLKSKKSEIANFSSYVNDVLRSLGFDFWLDPDKEDKSYELKHVDGEPISIDDISEGEKNLLALLYFYFEMLQNDEKSLKSDIQLVIIDDPIASLDDDNRFYIIETIKSLFEHQQIQMFVFTHLWSSFCDLAFGRNGKTTTNLYEVIKSNSTSTVIDSKAQEQPYKRLYSGIWSFSQEDINTIDDDVFLHMPNTIRRVLEDYVRFYAGIKNATSSSKEEISKVLMNEEYSSLSKNRRLQLTTLLSVANILSHRVPGNPSKKEIHDSAQFMMNEMSTNHKHHHNAMKTLNI